MRLLHTEIDVVPGRQAQHPLAEGAVGPGSALLRLQNAGAQENAYTIRVQCDHPYFQEDWYALRALPAPAVGPDGAPASVAGKADQYGPGNRWVKVFVGRGATRDVLLYFFVPMKPDSRAGRYPLRVVVETHLSEAAPGAAPRGKDRFTELPCAAVVHPYHRWSVDLTPEEGRVGILRPVTTFEAVVSNEGNDWLYCDLKLPRSKDLLLDAPAVRLAVPPPEPGEERMQRSVPVRAATRLRTVRGVRVLQPLVLTAARVDAPSVPSLPANLVDPHAAGAAAVRGSTPVLAAETSEVAQTPAERALVYCPPVPATLSDGLGALVRNGRALFFSAVALVALAPFAIAVWENLRHQTVSASPDPQHLQAAPGGKLPISGSYLAGSVIYVKASDGKEDEAVEIKPRIKQALPLEKQKAEIDLPREIGGKPLDGGRRIRIKAQRLGVLPKFFKSFLPDSDYSNIEVTVGTEAAPPVAERTASTGGKRRHGQVFRISRASGPPFPKDVSPRVVLGGEDAVVARWDGDVVEAQVPESAPEGSQVVTLLPPDGGKVTVNGSIDVIPKVEPSPTPDPVPTGGAGTGSDPVDPTPPPPPPPTPTPSTKVLPLPELAYNDLLNSDYDAALTRSERLLANSPDDPLGLAARAFVLAKQAKKTKPGKPDPSHNEPVDLVTRVMKLTQDRPGRARVVAYTAAAVLQQKAGNEAARRQLLDLAKKADVNGDSADIYLLESQ